LAIGHGVAVEDAGRVGDAGGGWGTDLVIGITGVGQLIVGGFASVCQLRQRDRTR
jgi:hypothetical protein